MRRKKKKKYLPVVVDFALLLAALALLAGVYYLLAERPLRAAEGGDRERKAVLETELAGLEARAAELERMKAELDAVDGETPVMASYNNHSAELSLLSSLLDTAATTYSISFEEAVREGEQVRRSFSLQFQTDSYAAAKQIISGLTRGGYRCLVGDLEYTAGEEGAGVSAAATFFETMSGGAEDPGLSVAGGGE